MTKARGMCSCGREWNALGQAHCSTCHEHFNSDSAFDRHRVGKWDARRCLDVEEFEQPMSAKNPKPRLVPILHPEGTIWATARMESVTADVERS